MYVLAHLLHTRYQAPNLRRPGRECQWCCSRSHAPASLAVDVVSPLGNSVADGPAAVAAVAAVVLVQALDANLDSNTEDEKSYLDEAQAPPAIGVGQIFNRAGGAGSAVGDALLRSWVQDLDDRHLECVAAVTMAINLREWSHHAGVRDTQKDAECRGQRRSNGMSSYLAHHVCD